MAADFHIPMLGQLPLDPRIGQSCDTGETESLFQEHEEVAGGGEPKSSDPVQKALAQLIQSIQLAIKSSQ